MHSERPRVRCSPNVADIREKDKARRLDEVKREGDMEGERKGRDLLLIANYPARQLHIITRHACTSACPFTLRFAILGDSACMCAYVRVYKCQCTGRSVRPGMRREGETDVPDSVTPTVGLFFSFSLVPPLLVPFFSFFLSRSFCLLVLFSGPLSAFARTLRYHCPISCFLSPQRGYR